MFLYEDSYFLNDLTNCSDHHVLICICDNNENLLLHNADDGEVMVTNDVFTLNCAEIIDECEKTEPLQHQRPRRYGPIFMVQPPSRVENNTFAKRSLHFSFAQHTQK
jgi:hypothetical protein